MGDLVVSADVIGKLLGVQSRQVYRLVKQGMPMAGKNKFHAPSVVKWFIDERSKSSGEAPDIQEQRKRLYKAQTDKTELENAQIRGELLSANAVQTTFLELGTRIRTQIESIEPRLARMLPKDSVDLLRTEIKAALEAISDDIATFADTRDDSEDCPTAS